MSSTAVASPRTGPVPVPPASRVRLDSVDLLRGLVMVIMALLCRWFAEVKARRRDAWLSYL